MSHESITGILARPIILTEVQEFEGMRSVFRFIFITFVLAISIVVSGFVYSLISEAFELEYSSGFIAKVFVACIFFGSLFFLIRLGSRFLPIAK